MKILLSNDDGYFTSGIKALTNELEKKHEIYVAAPSVNHSAGSSALSVRKDISIDNVKKNHYVIEGTPADCVHIALSCLIKEKIDVVVSGINLGANLGDDVIYSGTVAAALEGRHLEISPIAISLMSQNNISIDKAANISSNLFEEIILKRNILKNTLLNINIPDSNLDVFDTKFTRLGKRGIPMPATKSKKNNTYNIGSAGKPEDDSYDTDFYAIKENKISISPLTYDLTNNEILNKLNNT
tara:strand:+ start:338 stop:1063 length:726 start_codon:yes stop_codon:yes gene_type:complete